MIQISLTAALLLYSSILVLGALLIWFYTETAVRNTYRVLEKQHLWRCVFCAFTYLDEQGGPLSQCPRCNSFNANDDKATRFVKVKISAREADLASYPAESSRRNPSKGKRSGVRRRGPRRRR